LNDYYVVIPNYFLDGEVTKDELYIYYIIQRFKSCVDYKVIISSMLLADYIKHYFNFKFRKQRSKNANKVAEILKSLKNKNIISIDSFGAEEILFDTVIEIKLNKLDTRKGYEKIYYSVFDLADDPGEFMILCIIYRYQKISSRINYSYLARKTGVNYKVVSRVMQKMINEGEITRVQGRRYYDDNGELVIEKNRYYVNVF